MDYALNYEEPLLWEHRAADGCGVDFEPLKNAPLKTGQSARQTIGWPKLKEPQIVKHFVRLSTKNFSIDHGFFPLGSCTMKHNPRLNEKMA
ncbi:MAG: aminomethyl-transferring glycine dehydrogenase subunit GcvPB, partial [Alphaproteobacteria bacterium]|nr:aminomethyl-transferring glycine dehydrogenase subunit GcvPB [Alphaproteobacteria bacterium]